MSSLSSLNILKTDEAASSLKIEVENTLRSGKARSIFGIDNPISIPQASQETIDLQVQGLEREGFEKVWAESYVQMLKGVDKIPEAAAAKVVGFEDPTVSLVPALNGFRTVLSNVGIDAPVEWITTNSSKFFDSAADVKEGINDLQQGKTKKLAEVISNIDENIDESQVKEQLEQLTDIQTVDLPELEFNPAFPTFILDPFSLGLPEVPTGFTVPNPAFPSVNFAMLNLFMALVDGMKSVIASMQELLGLIVQGVGSFITGVVELLINKIIQPITDKLGPLLKSLLFAAVIATMISLLIGSIVVALIGFMVGTGLIAFSAANLLGLIQ